MDVIYDTAFVVDTRQYSGNFEREMGSYVVGADCARGEKEKALFDLEVRRPDNDAILDELLEKQSEARDHEYGDVASAICPTPERVNDGMGKHTDQGGMSHAASKNYPAYESVAIFFYGDPSDNLIAFMKARAIKFGELNDLTIVGFRLLKQKTVVTETAVTL